MALGVLLPGFEGTTLPAAYGELLSEGLGGICYFGSNTAAGPDAVATLSAAIRAANPGAVIAVDEEGGDVTRLHALTGSPVLGAAALGVVDDLVVTRGVGRTIGTELAAAGITLDLGPVGDVNSNPDNPVIGTRSFGADPALAARHVVAWSEGLRSAGVADCVKHYPGHGDTSADSHLDVPRIDAPAEVLAEREVLPFAAAVFAGASAVMTSHIVVSAWDPDRPATLSETVLTRLRTRLGFRGVIVSDALDMAGASGGRGIPEAAVLALLAGCDLLCLGPDKTPESVREVQSAVVDAVTDGRLPRARLEDAVRRIESLQVDPDAPTGTLDAERLAAAARQSLRVEGELPDLVGATVVTIETAANIAVGDVPWGLAVQGSFDDPPDGPLVVQVRDAHRRPEVGEAVARVAADGRAVVVVEWGWPGERSAYDGVPRICTHGYSRPGAAAVEALLSERGWTR